MKQWIWTRPVTSYSRFRMTILKLEDLLDRRPRELSGGQQQRVALGRAMVRKPSVFLFDEPLSNLDARLRGDMRAMIKKMYNRLRVTSIYVTHDQVEAMTIGEQLVVMNEGRIHQVGPPEACYREPTDTFVASFLGSPPMNFLDTAVGPGGEVTIGGRQATVPAPAAAFLREGGDDVLLGIRPEHIQPAWYPDLAKVLKQQGYGYVMPISYGNGDTLFFPRGPLAQLVEHRTFNPVVAGSNPARLTNS